jgi:dihydrofolate synthase/folylpolyglutamate synthase
MPGRTVTTARPCLAYEDALVKIMGLADFERGTHSPGHGVFHLDRMRLLLERVGNPHLDVPTIHVAGTKGKGSTAAMITSILVADGCTTGLYTSPHLHRVTERIRVGLDPIGRESFAGLVEELWPEAEYVSEHGEYGDLTFFEFVTAMAFLHFAKIRADFQVIEVGLGGRLDATNVVSPQVCVITPIMLDHVLVLGDTIELIAGEKAGIIKPGVPVVASPQSSTAIDVFARVASERDARLVQVSEVAEITPGAVGLDGQTFELRTGSGVYDLHTTLLGDYQRDNAATAVTVVEMLSRPVSREGIVEGLAGVRWPARMQLMSANGVRVLADGAHNPESVAHLREAVGQYFDFERLILVFGATRSHSEEGMLSELAALSPVVAAVKSRHPKSATPETVAEAARATGLEVALVSDDVGEAVSWAAREASPDDLVLATGSLAVAAAVIEKIEGIEPEIYEGLRI